MTDDARIARLTELARKVWPDEPVEVHVDPQTYGVRAARAEILADPGEAGVEVYGHRKDIGRTLDALEAALCALACEPPQWAAELAESFRAEGNRLDRVNEFNSQAYILFRCADRLLDAAKGKP